MTRDRTQDMAVRNVERNSHRIARGKSIRDLRGMTLGAGDSAVVIAAGPSVHKNDPLKTLKAAGYAGAVVSTESAFRRCIAEGVEPHLIVSVDPHPQRIVRWFGDPNLKIEHLEGDDYFRRQDLDQNFADEQAHNVETLRLLDKHGRGIRIALASCASADVVERVHDIGMDVYWWNPMLDDPDRRNSVTRSLCKQNGLPAMNAGGNVGTSCWMLAHAVLNKQHVAVTGMDFAYYADTPYQRTQYYKEALALVGEERLHELYIRIFNPFIGTWFYTDPAYYWYRQAFLELVRDAECKTYNCTGGGILFGDGISFIKLSDFLAQHTMTGDPAGHGKDPVH